MPATLEELKDWLDDLVKAGSLSDEDRKGLEATFGKPGVADYIKGGQMRQSDYSRQMNELTTKQKEIETEKGNVAVLQQQLVDYKGTNEAKYTKMVEDLKASQTRQFQLEQKLQMDYGLDPATILGTTGGAITTDPNRIDTSSFLSKAEFDTQLASTVKGQIQGAATDLINWTNSTFEMQQRASELGIKNYSPKAVMDKMVETQNWNPDQVFDQLYNATAIQTAKTQADYDAAITKARDEGIAKGRQEASLPAAQRANAPSLVQALIKGNEGQSPADTASTSVTSDKSHVVRAADALRATMGSGDSAGA